MAHEISMCVSEVCESDVCESEVCVSDVCVSDVCESDVCESATKRDPGGGDTSAMGYMQPYWHAKTLQDLIMSTEKLNIAIAGRGLAGRLLAWRLALAGHQISLMDNNPSGQDNSAARSAAAMISPMSEVVISEKAIYELGLKSLALWREWLFASDELASMMHLKGSVAVAHPHDESELQQFHKDLDYHLGPQNQSQWLNREEINRLEPDLSDSFHSALHLPNEAHIDNRQLLDYLDRYLEEHVHCAAHCQIEIDEYCMANGVPLPHFDLLLDCRGTGGRLSNVNVRGVRGEIMHIHCEEINLQRPVRLMHPRYKLYVVPKPDNCYVLGATELESDDRSPMSVKSALELCSALYTISPGFAEARITEMDVNLRPALPDNMPLISAASTASAEGKTQKIVSLNGLYRHGYLIAPTLVQQIIESWLI